MQNEPLNPSIYQVDYELCGFQAADPGFINP